jgi:uncharacterized NAD(P)/FAD-binding protein YdhS
VRFEHIESQVSDVTTNTRDRQSAFVVGLTDGRQLAADEFVLAIGSVPAAPPKVLANLPSEFLVADPWRPGGLEGIPKDGDVLLIGSGLTMVDVALALDDPAAPTRRIVARSRRGLLPLDHRPGPIAIWPGFEMPSSKTAAGIMHAFRGAAEKAFADGWDWRAVVAATRPHLTEIWQGLPTIEQRRLLKHAMRYWEIHRHPMAPKVAAQVDQLRATGRLSVGPGTVTRAEVVGPRVRAVLETSQRPESVEVVKVVYCAGPDCDVVTSHPLAQQMRGAGLVRRHANGVGLAVDADGHLLGAGGLNSSLHAVGFVRRGEELESSAVREIRLQAERLADRLAWAIDGTEHIGAWEAEVRADRSIAPSRLRK